MVAANYNSPGQIVISGTRRRRARPRPSWPEPAGAKKVVRLAVSGAFHSPLMEFAVPGLKEGLAKVTVNGSRVPLISNVEAAPVSEAGSHQILACSSS